MRTFAIWNYATGSDAFDEIKKKFWIRLKIGENFSKFYTHRRRICGGNFRKFFY